VQKDFIHQAEYRRVRAYAQRHDHNSERGKAWIAAEIPARIPQIAQQIFDVIHVAHIPAFLLVLLHSVHCAKRRKASLFRGEASRHLQFDALIDVKLELLFELLFYTIPSE